MSTRPAVRQLGRLSEIAQVAAKHGFGYVFDTRRLGDGLSRRHRELEVAEGGSTRGARLRAMLDELGPTFVKFGQLLSTRPDVVPPDIVFELKALQDDVTPFPFEQAEKVIDQELGLTVAQLFTEFDRIPIAAASIGQVHRAVLPNGKRVVVKVQRPDAPRQIEADLELLYQAARFARERIKALAFIDTVSLVDEFARTIRQELDYRMEARNAEQFHRNFAGHPHVRIPRVFWTYSRSRVLTLEYLEGVHLRDLDFATYTIEERARLAEVIADAWMAMIFRHGFFHADPHPSNILVLEQSEQIGLVDFGMAGKLTGEDMSKATRLFIDIVSENIERLPRDLAALGVRYDRKREEEFITEIRDLYYRYYGSRLNEIDPIQVIREVFAVIFRMRLELPTRFVMLDRAIATLGSVGLELYPDFNVFEVARPYARELMLERFTPRRVASRTRQQGSDYLRILLDAPYQIADTLEQVRDGQIEVGFRHAGLEELFHRLDLVFNRLTVAIVSVGGIIGSSLIGIFADAGPKIWGLHFLSVIGFSLSALLGIWLVWGVIRSGRL
ncbi:MAG: AarF/ABC1/UbiB kinase family protein [Actinomycetota bacterium]|nr:AarF/ABC1/UbiB kinase family protein [Actinomycetota bacterium]